jgi:hypothetical protein
VFLQYRAYHGWLRTALLLVLGVLKQVVGRRDQREDGDEIAKQGGVYFFDTA